MSKRFYILLGTAVLVCSLAAGVLFYETARESELIQSSLDEYEWYLPLTDTYDWIGTTGLKQEAYRVSNNGKQEALIDHFGNRILKNLKNFSSAKGSCVLYWDYDNEKYGYMDSSGKILTPAKFEEAGYFEDGYASVDLGLSKPKRLSQMGILNEKGELLYNTSKDPKHQNYPQLNQIDGRYFFICSTADTADVFDAQTCTKILQTDKYDAIKKVTKGLYAASFYDDEQGECVELLNEDFEPAFEGRVYNRLDAFSEGLCYGTVKVGDKEKNGYIGKDGELKIKTGKSLWGTPFSEGKAFVMESDKIYCIDKEGKRLFEKKLLTIQEKEHYEDKMIDEVYAVDYCYFRHGRAILFDGKKYGIVDEEGSWIVPPMFRDAEFAGEDAALLCYRDMYGILKVR